MEKRIIILFNKIYKNEFKKLNVKYNNSNFIVNLYNKSLQLNIKELPSSLNLDLPNFLNNDFEIENYFIRDFQFVIEDLKKLLKESEE